jgi:hypothetical protein
MRGIDVPIESLRSTFEDLLWIANRADFYGRCMRNYRDNVTPEVLIEDSKEYTEVLLDDTKDVISFFDVQPKRDERTASINIFFAVNLQSLYPTVPERATEYALQDVLMTIKRHAQFTVTGITEGYEAWKEWDKVKKEDNMHPFYLFRIETTVEYSLTCN